MRLVSETRIRWMEDHLPLFKIMQLFSTRPTQGCTNQGKRGQSGDVTICFYNPNRDRAFTGHLLDGKTSVAIASGERAAGMRCVADDGKVIRISLSRDTPVSPERLSVLIRTVLQYRGTYVLPCVIS